MRWKRPEFERTAEIVAEVAFLASPDSDFIIGAALESRHERVKLCIR